MERTNYKKILEFFPGWKVIESNNKNNHYSPDLILSKGNVEFCLIEYKNRSARSITSEYQYLHRNSPKDLKYFYNLKEKIYSNSIDTESLMNLYFEINIKFKTYKKSSRKKNKDRHCVIFYDNDDEETVDNMLKAAGFMMDNHRAHKDFGMTKKDTYSFSIIDEQSFTEIIKNPPFIKKNLPSNKNLSKKELLEKNKEQEINIRDLMMNQRHKEMAERFETERVQEEKKKEPFHLETPTETFENIVLPEESIEKINMTLSQIEHSDLIFNKWGLGKSIGYGKGVIMNFSGQPGTGKTLAAKVIANALKKKIMIVKYSQLLNKWVGGSEKNIAKVFSKAKKEDAVLFFDEADAIVTSRKMAMHTWELTTINVLLSELERFEGVCIFATNMVNLYDSAIERRISLHLEFKNPDHEARIKIFQNHFPVKEALNTDVVFDEIAKKYEFTGGDIKNIVLTAARIASSDTDNTNQKISMKHLEKATDIIVNNKKIMYGEIVKKQAYMG